MPLHCIQIQQPRQRLGPRSQASLHELPCANRKCKLSVSLLKCDCYDLHLPIAEALLPIELLPTAAVEVLMYPALFQGKNVTSSDSCMLHVVSQVLLWMGKGWASGSVYSSPAPTQACHLAHALFILRSNVSLSMPQMCHCT